MRTSEQLSAAAPARRRRSPRIWSASTGTPPSTSRNTDAVNAVRTAGRDECAERQQRRDPGRPRIPEEGERGIAQAQRIRTCPKSLRRVDMLTRNGWLASLLEWLFPAPFRPLPNATAEVSGGWTSILRGNACGRLGSAESGRSPNRDLAAGVDRKR